MIRTIARKVRALALRARYYGRSRFCPVCETHSSSFVARGVVPRPDASCPHCDALERHRLIWLFFNRRTDLFAPPRKKMLHFAPERCFADRLRNTPNVEWLSADLLDPSAMLKVDITGMQLPDDSFDAIYCSHVLEHVPDDRAGMRELARVLRPSGWALVQVPITSSLTFEDPNITDPAERERVFGQWNHVRTYGPDVEERLTEAGFDVQCISGSDVATPEEFERMGLRDNDWIYFCRPRGGLEGAAAS